MNVPDTWQAAHCVQCFQQPDECERCGCHTPPIVEAPTGSTIARLDGCPKCVINTEVPYGAFNASAGMVALYKCTDCGHRWHTSWHKEVAA